MRSRSQIDILQALGSSILRVLSTMPEIDKDVALSLVGQIPEIATLAKTASADADKVFDSVLNANARSMEMRNEIDVKVLSIFEAQLDKDLSSEERLLVYDYIRNVPERTDRKDTEDKAFLADQSTKLLGVHCLAATVPVLAVLFAAAKSGIQPAAGAARLFAA